MVLAPCQLPSLEAGKRRSFLGASLHHVKVAEGNLMDRRAEKLSLLMTHPDVATEWHPTENAPMTPDMIAANSAKKVVWQCYMVPSHIWEATVHNRAVRGQKCPYCRGKYATPETSLQALYPDLAKEWHPTENGSLTPDMVTARSNKKIIWQCQRNTSHIWKTSVQNRTKRGDGCKKCSGREATPETSFGTLYPDLAKEWHPKRNSHHSPDTVTPGSKYLAWWRCQKDPTHEWPCRVQHRAHGGIGCPYCSGRYATPKTSLAALYPELAKEWHPTENKDLSPEYVKPKSDKIVFWQCRVNLNHVWSAAIKSRVRGNGCPICANRAVTPENSLLALHPNLASEWHPTKNGNLTPADVVPGSERIVTWQCQEYPTHVWSAMVRNRAIVGSGCLMCAGQVATLETSLLMINPSLAQEWNFAKNDELTPDQVLPQSSKRVWWRCSKDASHEWDAVINSRSAGSGCPYCAGQRTTQTTSLEALFPQLAQEWHPDKNDFTPDQVLPGSGFVVWWQCVQGHEWKARIQHRANGVGCPYCYKGGSSSLEEAFAEALDACGAAYQRQVPIGRYHADFYLPATHTIVEIQGCYWHACLQCGYTEAIHQKIRQKDASRRHFLQTKGYSVEELWEHAFPRKVEELQLLVAQKFGLVPRYD